MTTLSHEPLAPWIHQLPDVAAELAADSISLDAAYIDAQAMVKNIEAVLLRRKEALLRIITQLWTREQIEAAKQLIADDRAPKEEPSSVD